MASNCEDLISQSEFGLEGCTFSHINSNGNCVFLCGGARVEYTPALVMTLKGAPVKAPVGYHFMLKDSDYYLMKTVGKYKPHIHEGYESRLSIKIQIDKVHTASTIKATKKGARY